MSTRKIAREVGRQFDFPMKFSTTGTSHLRIDLPNGEYVTCSSSPRDEHIAVKRIVKDIKVKMGEL